MEIFKEYADLKNQAKELEKRMNLMKPEIIRQVKEMQSEDNLIKTSFGTFKLSERITWVYSDKLKAQIAKDQEKEIAKGVAEKKISDVLTYK